MPIITVETSIALNEFEREAALRALVWDVTDRLAIKPPTQLRLRLIDVPVDSIAVGDEIGVDAAPWIVAHVEVLEGRSDEQLDAFMVGFTATLASVLGVDVTNVRVLLTNVPKRFWSIGPRTAAGLGR